VLMSILSAGLKTPCRNIVLMLLDNENCFLKKM